jgi:1-phosphofructokinase
MILSITPAPAIDLTLELEHLELGEVNRSLNSTREASGKGVNVSWALHRAGIATRALFPAGGHGAALMADQLNQAGLPYRMVPIQAELRTNLTLRPHSGSETKINSAGSAMTGEELGKFLDAVSAELDDASDVVISGSAPDGAPTSLHADIVVLARKKGVRALVDTSGAPLRECLNALPDVVAPNLHELAELTQASLITVADVVSAAETILARGVGTVVVSMGPLGALLANHSTMLWGSAEDVTVVNAVGAGDALLAGLVSAGSDPVEMLSAGIWWASSAVESPSTLFELNPHLRSRVSVSDVLPMTTRVH